MTKYMYTKNIREIIGWDIINWSFALAFWETNTSKNLTNSSALEIGAHDGGLSLWLAQKGCKIVCSDLNGPTKEAQEKHQRYGVRQLIEYQAVDVLDIPYDAAFDIVMFKSVLGGIGRNEKKELQISAFKQLHKALVSGGELFFAENLAASPFHRFFRKRFVRWGAEWRYVSIQEMKEFLSIFTSYQFKSVGFLGVFGRTEWQRSIFGFLDRILFNYITPAAWRYIIVGIAKK